MAENQAKATPARVLLLFTFLFAAVVATVWRQKDRPVQVQTIWQPDSQPAKP